MMKQSSFFVFCIFLFITGCAPQWDLHHLVGVYHGEKRWAQPEPGDLFPSVKYEVDLVLDADSTFEVHQWHAADSSSVHYWGEWTHRDSMIFLDFMGTIHYENGFAAHLLFDHKVYFLSELGGYLRITGNRELTGNLICKWESVTINLSE